MINLNDIANSLKPVFLPGEIARTCGSSSRAKKSGQGVGYLDDGTMIVVEGGRDHIGKEVKITVTSVLQTMRRPDDLWQGPAGRFSLTLLTDDLAVFDHDRLGLRLLGIGRRLSGHTRTIPVLPATRDVAVCGAIGTASGTCDGKYLRCSAPRSGVDASGAERGPSVRGRGETTRLLGIASRTTCSAVLVLAVVCFAVAERTLAAGASAAAPRAAAANFFFLPKYRFHSSDFASLLGLLGCFPPACFPLRFAIRHLP